MQALYPIGPAAIPETLTRPSSAYRRQAWVATLALLAFAVFYLGLAGWFSWKAYSLLRASVQGSRDGLWLFLGSSAAAFIAIFMIKALFFVRRGELADLIEVKAQEQPELFAFLYRLADEARAPRPRKVYLSPRVNAAVFYDLSPLNLLLPSHKNLEIGLALVNVLNVSELKAVLAHEFGHFAQRSMALGRWVYIAQQIAGHIVAHRDILDRFLRGLSAFDLRIAWIGWLMSLVVWSIRSVVDTFFRVVLAAERALSREMEFQADLVSVSLCGSDALIDALYRCQSADTAWDRTLSFADAQVAKGKLIGDLFDIQSRIIEHLRKVTDDPTFGAPPRPEGDGAAHRIFKKELVHASRMWATHPFNHEREDNAKRHYLPVQMQFASAWALFRDVAQLREQSSAAMFGQGELPVASHEESIAALEAEYGREAFKRIYRGCYLSRFVTRTAGRLQDLYADGGVDRAGTYPASLSADLKELEALKGEKAQLAAVQAGVAQAADGLIRFRGKAIEPRQLALVVQQVAGELDAVRARLAAHDRLCRSAGRELARAHGLGWEPYLSGLLSLVHYAEHTRANLIDAHGAMSNAIAMVTAKRRVNDKERQRVLVQAGRLHSLLGQIHADAGSVRLDPEFSDFSDWPAALGDWGLAAPALENLGDWLDVVDSWLQPVVDALGKLRRYALDALLVAEGRLGRAAYEAASLGEAPNASAAPEGYPSFVEGSERPLQRKLDWWSRFQVADGWLPGAFRLLVACGIIGGLMGMSSSLGNARLVIHNGLDRQVQVQVGKNPVQVGPGGMQAMELELDGAVQVTARTAAGQLIESFTEAPEVIGAHYVYNVASASPMTEWTAVYGSAASTPDRPLGTPRWFISSVDVLLQAAPVKIQGKGGGATRSILSAAEGLSVNASFAMTEDPATRAKVIQARARWDGEGSASLMDWLALASEQPGFDAVLKARLAEQPLDIITLRMEQETGTPLTRDAVCERHRGLAAKHPAEGDLQYLAVRCMEEGPARDAAFQEGHAKYPASSWFAFAAASGFEGVGDWSAAAKAHQTAMKVPALADHSATELARLRRLEHGVKADLKDLLAKSESLRLNASVEAGTGMSVNSPARIYFELNRGQLAEATQLLATVNRSDPHALRLAAASDGAPRQLVERSLALDPKAGIDEDTVWSSIGLALRQGQSIESLMASLQGLEPEPEQVAAMNRFIDVIRSSRDPRQAEAALVGASLPMRAHAYVMGIVFLGAQAPAHWRDFARKVLFPSERPYLG